VTGLRFGRVLGFEIRADNSWFILFALVLWSFTAMVFPQNEPGLGRGAYLLMGLAGTVLLFISLLIHELAHSIIARMKGIPVEGITLFLLGGMAQTRTEAESPGDEFQIAIAGPAASFGVAAVLVAGWYVGATVGMPGSVLAVLQYIAALNVLLAVFNLLPGFPLDGGRIFRAGVWKLTGDVERATHVASITGRWIGYGLMALGVWAALTGSVLGGVWLVLIGWFLRNAALRSYRQHLLLTLLSGVRADRVMSRDVHVVAAGASIRSLMEERFMRQPYGAYPVMEGEDVRGLVTLDAAQRVPREDWDARTAADVMVPAQPLMVSPDEHLVNVMEKLRSTETRRALVMRDDHLLGIITPADVAFWLERTRRPNEPGPRTQ
jgi:Zn-dependent protease/predicted transcriptional regulator